MNVEIETEAAQFPEYINVIFVAVYIILRSAKETRGAL